MEGEAFLLGNWKNFREIEENLSLQELELIVTAAREAKMREQRFMAALKGIDLDADETVDLVEQKKRELEARNAGVSVDALDFIDMGIDVITD